MHNGEAVAVSAVLDCHLKPHSNGTMSLRKTFHHAQIESDAVARLQFLNWEGAAMVEYRLDETSNTFRLIEINFRFWQYLHLDLMAGIDFPLIQVSYHLGQSTSTTTTPKLGIVARDTFPGEFAHWVNQFRSSDNVLQKLASCYGFLRQSLDPGTKPDLWFAGDRRLYFIALKRFLSSEIVVQLLRIRSKFKLP